MCRNNPLRVMRVLIANFAVLGLWGAEHHGTVKSGALPIPGASVTVTQGDKKVTTTTDESGVYEFRDLADGIWSLEIEMFGFAKLSHDIAVAPSAPSPEWQLTVLPLSALKANVTAAAPAAPSQPAAAAQASDQKPPRPNFRQRPAGAESRSGTGGQPSLRQALAQNGFQQANVNAAADPATLGAENNQNGSTGNESTFADLNQSASDALVVNGSVSSGLNLPQQNDWFGFGRGFENGFGPGGPPGLGAPGFGADAAAAQGGPAAAGPGGPGGPTAGPGGGPGGRAGFPGGFGGGFGRGGGRRGGFNRGGRGGNLNAFGNARRNRRQQYNGNVALILDNSALDARSYSLTGQQTPKPAYARFRTTGMFGGPLKIPHLVSGQNTFFTINYQLSRNRNANTLSALVPTDTEKNGDFTGAVNQITGKPITLTGFAGNLIPASQISPQAQALLNWYPAPNFSGNPRYNYQIPVISVTDQNNVNVRLNHTINSKNQINGNFAWQNSSGPP